MLPTAPSHPPATAPVSDYEPLARYPDFGGAFEEALVVLSMGLACEIGEDAEGGFTLLAEPAMAERIQRELECYRSEQALPLPPPPPPDRRHGSGAGLTLLWLLALVGSFRWQNLEPGWTGWGLCSPSGIFEHGQWWRPFTALFLHADFGHLLSNTTFGVFFGTWVCRSLGAVRGWPLILLAGTLGNLVNAAAHRGLGFASLGASTAVFGAVGILTGVSLHESMRDRSRRGRFRYLLPLGGGLAMFSMWGVGSDPRIDVIGHLCGFLCGLLLGTLAAWAEFLAAARMVRQQGTGTRPAGNSGS